MVETEGKYSEAERICEEILEELFLASLTRRPTVDEVEVAKRVIAKDRMKGIENIEWALLNSTEFLVNH